MYLLAVVSALDTHARDHVQPTDPPVSDADAWFSALDGRTIELGPSTYTALVLGIHTSPDGLWIQLSCEGDTDISVVVHVTPATRVEDVTEEVNSIPAYKALAADSSLNYTSRFEANTKVIPKK